MNLKKILLFGLLISFNCFGQKYVDTLFNFNIKDGNILWQKIYEDNSKDLEKKYLKQIITNSKAKNIQEIDKTITFTIENEKINFKKYGGSIMSTAFFVQNPNNYMVVVNFKKNKYRISIKTITSTSTDDDEITELESYVSKKNKIRNSKFNRKNLLILDKHFSEKYKLKKLKEDW